MYTNNPVEEAELGDERITWQQTVAHMQDSVNEPMMASGGRAVPSQQRRLQAKPGRRQGTGIRQQRVNASP